MLLPGPVFLTFLTRTVVPDEWTSMAQQTTHYHIISLVPEHTNMSGMSGTRVHILQLNFRCSQKRGTFLTMVSINNDGWDSNALMFSSVCAWISSGFSGFILLPKNIPVGGLATIHCIYSVYSPRVYSRLKRSAPSIGPEPSLPSPG